MKITMGIVYEARNTGAHYCMVLADRGDYAVNRRRASDMADLKAMADAVITRGGGWETPAEALVEVTAEEHRRLSWGAEYVCQV